MKQGTWHATVIIGYREYPTSPVYSQHAVFQGADYMDAHTRASRYISDAPIAGFIEAVTMTLWLAVEGCK